MFDYKLKKILMEMKESEGFARIFIKSRNFCNYC